ncbi:MAG: hypothetical protein NTY03_02795 [Candidatus Bathyarchaeota archaeon]|nr:hypothetical protein [Candidatus Bathyarchaeota archaeon]
MCELDRVASLAECVVERLPAVAGLHGYSGSLYVVEEGSQALGVVAYPSSSDDVAFLVH